MAACSGDEGDDLDPVAVSVTESPYITLAGELALSAGTDVYVEVTARSGDHVVEVPRTVAAAREHAIPLMGMRAERTYTVDVDLLDATGEVVRTETTSFTTGAVPDDFLDFEFQADVERSAPGVTIVEVTPGNEVTPYLMAVDGEGEVVWYYRNTGTVGGVEPTPRGTLATHYWPLGLREVDLLGNVVGNWHFAAPQDADGSHEEVIDDDLLEAFTSLAAGNDGDPDPLPVEPESFELTSFHHEVWPMPGGNLLGLGTTVHELTPQQRATFCPDDPTEFGVISDVVVEFGPSGRVVREWDLWHALDIDEVPGHELCADSGPFASETDRDWLHANAVVYDEARDAIVVSARHTNQLIALRHLDDLGAQSEVLWVFGEVGTVPVDGDLPHYQHAPEVQADGSILVYDNGNDRPGTALGDPDTPTYSRAVLYDVDDTSENPDDWTVTQLWEHRTTDVDGSPLYARFLGDADRLENGNVLITHGGIDLPGDDDYQHAVLIEVVPDGSDGGEIVWELVIGTPDAEATVYRSERLPSLYFGPDWDTTT